MRKTIDFTISASTTHDLKLPNFNLFDPDPTSLGFAVGAAVFDRESLFGRSHAIWNRKRRFIEYGHRA